MTALGRRFLSTACLLWCVSLILSVKVIYYPALFMILLIIGSGILTWVNGRSLYVMFFTSSRKLARGDDLVVEYMLTNRSIFPIFFMDVHIEFKKEMGLAKTQESDVADAHRDQFFFAPFRIMTFKRAARCQHRGFYKVGNMTVVVRDPIGFFEKTIKFEKAVNITVYPKMYPLSINLPPPMGAEGSLGSRHKFNEERTHLSNLRAYQEGDSMQSIHWKVSARLGQPVVKNYQVRAQNTLTIMVNGTWSDYDSGDDLEALLLDERTVELAISYGWVCRQEGMAVRIIFCGKRRGEVRYSKFDAAAAVLEEATAYELSSNLDFHEVVMAEMIKSVVGTRIVMVTPDAKGEHQRWAQRWHKDVASLAVVDSLKADVATRMSIKLN